VYALDFPTHVVKEIAVPRDMDAIVAGHENKINAAYAIGGEKMTDQVVGEFLGLPKNDKGRYFDRYITLRINATKEFIDAIGGIDINVEKEMNYDDNWGHLHIHFHPGMQHMNGDQAVSYARFRHDACGDPCRIRRQQLVTRVAIQKLKSEKFNDLTHIAQLIGVINRNVVTNLSGDEMRSLAWAFRDINMSDIKTAQVAYTDDKELPNAGDVLIPDEKQKAQLVADFLGPYVAATPPPDPASIAAIDPKTVHVAVENGSGESGMGKKMADQLTKLGFIVDKVGNADSFGYDTTVIREHSKVTGIGERLRRDLALKTAAVTPAPAASASAAPEATDATIIVGRDFVTAMTSQPGTKTP
jgi:LCP family protein required for cell wall assembly